MAESASDAGYQIDRCGQSGQTVHMATIAFLHGVGGVSAGWDAGLLAGLADLNGLGSRSDSAQARVESVADPKSQKLVAADLAVCEFVEIVFDDVVNRSGIIRRSTAGQAPEASLRSIDDVVGIDSADYPRRSAQRRGYQQRQQGLRRLIWECDDRVMPPKRLPPPLLPGEVMVRLPFLSMRQAGHYRHDAQLRTTVLDRVESALTDLPGPVILLAHSLGSVVALDAMHTRNISVDLFVSFGSPLGQAGFWGKQWEDPATFPYARIGAWLNIVNLNDPIPWLRGASYRFPQAYDTFIRAGSGLVGPGNWHDAATYTSTQSLVRAVDAAMRNDFAVTT